MTTADTSVVVAVLSGWHEHHAQAVAAAEEVSQIPAQVLLESASVLTRLPGGLARPLSEVIHALQMSFSGSLLTLPAIEHWKFLERMAQAGLGGGALYDAVIAATANDNGMRLLTLDRRAITTYRALGAEVVVVA